MNSLFASAHDVIFTAMGETITWAGAPIKAICVHASEMVGGDTLTLEDRLTVDGRYSEVASPAAGAAVVRRSARYVADRVTRLDDYVWSATCRAIRP